MHRAVSLPFARRTARVQADSSNGDFTPPVEFHTLSVFSPQERTMNPYQELERLKITLPTASTPVAAFVMATQTGNVVFVSGHIARKDGKPLVGQLGRELSTQEGQAAARSIAIDLMATLHGFLGDLRRVTRILKLLCLVNSVPTFTEQHLVANGCSELLLTVFGDRGKHARSAFGVAQIPLGACVEIEMVVEVSPA
jgi:enamine deaminase RidA (YjgF/YER057c/UK114 family)